MRTLIEAHKFFCRKSQHYIMGDWNEYQEWLTPSGFNWTKFRYYRGFIPAYIRFMSYYIRDLLTSKKPEL